MPEFNGHSSVPPQEALGAEIGRPETMLRRQVAPARIKDTDRLVLTLQALARGLEISLGSGTYRLFKRGQVVRTPAGWLELEEDRLLRRTAAPQALARHFLAGARHPCPHPSTPHASNPAAYALYVDEDVTVNWLVQAVSKVDEMTLTRWAIESAALASPPPSEPAASLSGAGGPLKTAHTAEQPQAKPQRLRLVQANG